MLAAAASELNSGGPGKVSWQAADLTRPQEVQQAVAAVEGPVDVLVNNAGGAASRDMPQGELAEVARAWEADYQSNVLSTLSPSVTGARKRRMNPATGGSVAGGT